MSSDPREKQSFTESEAVEVLREVYWAGWLNASTWANRDDQLDDRGSEAYKKLEGEAVRPALASLSAPKPESVKAVFLRDIATGIWEPLYTAPPRPEAVGEVFGPKAVSTMVALERPLPPGTKLYAAPPHPEMWDVRDGQGDLYARQPLEKAASIVMQHPDQDLRLSPAPRPEASAPDATAVGVEVASLPALWRQREDNGEERTEFDKGYEQASDECAEALERALTQQPAADATSVAVDEAALNSAADALCGEWNMHYPDAVRMTKTVLTTLLAGQSLKNESDQEQQGGTQE